MGNLSLWTLYKLITSICTQSRELQKGQTKRDRMDSKHTTNDTVTSVIITVKCCRRIAYIHRSRLFDQLNIQQWWWITRNVHQQKQCHQPIELKCLSTRMTHTRCSELTKMHSLPNGQFGSLCMKKFPFIFDGINMMNQWVRNFCQFGVWHPHKHVHKV